MDIKVIWPEIFESQDFAGRSDIELAADALIAWGNCQMGRKYNPDGPHPNFGEVMAKIGERLGIVPLGENLMEWTDKWLAANQAKKS